MARPASPWGGLAPSFTVLVTARALQGVFAALLAPAIPSLLNTTFTEPQERAKRLRHRVGLLIGGSLTQFLDWRWTMFINVVFAVVFTAGGARLVAHTRDKAGTRLDLPEAATISAGLFALVYGFSNAESRSWGSPMAWGFLAAGVILIIAFVLWQRGAPPMASAVRASPRSQAWAWSVS